MDSWGEPENQQLGHKISGILLTGETKLGILRLNMEPIQYTVNKETGNGTTSGRKIRHKQIWKHRQCYRHAKAPRMGDTRIKAKENPTYNVL